MFQTFRHTTSAAGFQEALAPLPLRRYDPNSGEFRCDDAIPFKVVLQGQSAPGAGVYQGARARITPTMGVGRPVQITLGDQPVEWTGIGQGVRVEVQRLGTNDVQITGSVSADCPGLVVGHKLVTNLVRSDVLSLAQATADGAITGPSAFAAAQEASTAFAWSVAPLSGGGAMVPVQVSIWARRTLDGVGVDLATFTVSSAIPGGGAYGRIVVPRTLYDGIAYQVVGFPGVGGGSSSLEVWEEVDP